MFLLKPTIPSCVGAGAIPGIATAVWARWGSPPYIDALIASDVYNLKVLLLVPFVIGALAPIFLGTKVRRNTTEGIKAALWGLAFFWWGYLGVPALLNTLSHNRSAVAGIEGWLSAGILVGFVLLGLSCGLILYMVVAYLPMMAAVKMAAAVRNAIHDRLVAR